MSDDAEKRTHRRRVRVWYQALLSDIPEGYTPLEAAVSIKALDEQGNVRLINQKTKDLATWEALGMLISASDDMRAALNSYATEDEE